MPSLMHRWAGRRSCCSPSGCLLLRRSHAHLHGSSRHVDTASLKAVPLSAGRKLGAGNVISDITFLSQQVNDKLNPHSTRTSGRQLDDKHSTENSPGCAAQTRHERARRPVPCVQRSLADVFIG
jgi:hypothetical protein